MSPGMNNGKNIGNRNRRATARRGSVRRPDLTNPASWARWRNTWHNAGVAQKTIMAGTAMVSAVLVVALVLALIRVVEYQRLVATAREQQREFTVEYDFNPGDIISDRQFFDAESMGVDQIQDFINAKGAKCSGDQCLKSKTFDVEAQDADGLCGAVEGATGQSAAQVVSTAAKACGVSPKVLLTLMQKEQHLVTAAPPSDWNYQAAMGLSCPDDASCDPQYAGFVNQVIGSARRFRYYLANGERYKFRTGRVNAIQYHPNVVCGTGNVFIENDATRLLYIYTPYQPNAAALAAGTGTGDGCSSYGNRNFSIIYASWFGDPRE